MAKVVREMTIEDYEDSRDNDEGICLDCGEIVDGVEPDAEGYECPACGKRRVMGIEQALVLGRIGIVED